MNKHSLASTIAKKIQKDKLFDSLYNIFETIRKKKGLEPLESIHYLEKILREKKIKKGLTSTLLPLFDELKKAHSLSSDELILTILLEVGKKYKISKKTLEKNLSPKNIQIPLSIFSPQLGFLESLVKYLHENQGYSFPQISALLNRKSKTIRNSYYSTKKKKKHLLTITKKDETIRLDLLTKKGLTILESLIFSLRKKGLRYSRIGNLICRDQRNVWTVYSRVNKKLKGGKNE